MSGWGCQHYVDGECKLLEGECIPGKKGCVLYGRYTFSDPRSPSNEAVERRKKNNKKRENNE